MTIYCFQHRPGEDNDTDDPGVDHGGGATSCVTTKSESSWNLFRKTMGNFKHDSCPVPRTTELCHSMGELTPMLEMLMRRNRAGLCFKTIRND